MAIQYQTTCLSSYSYGTYANYCASQPSRSLPNLAGLGIISCFARIRSKSAAIVGLDGVGAYSAELLTRTGIGRLLLLDSDKVHLADMGSLFYRPAHVGRARVEAAAQLLLEVNADIAVEAVPMELVDSDGVERLRDVLAGKGGRVGGNKGVAVGGKGRPGEEGPEEAGKQVDLVLCCVRSWEARRNIDGVGWGRGGKNEWARDR